MSKKRRKSSSNPIQGKWESGLVGYNFEEDTWNANLQFVVENDLLDAEHIEALANVVNIPQRRLFSYLHKDDLMKMVNELGNPKNKKPPKLPQFYEITEITYGMLNAGQEIPLPLWSKLIKFGLINIKDIDLRRKEESKLKGEKEKGAKKRPRSKSPGKSKGKKTPEPQLPKKDWSTLKKRGEEDDGLKYIDDEPDDGPQHYIFISGFRSPQLLPLLSELGVNVNGVIKIESESYDAIKTIVDKKRAAEQLDDDAQSVAQAKLKSDRKELSLFWKLLPAILQRAPASSRLQDLAVHRHVVTDTILPSDWDDQDMMIGYGTTLFEELAVKVYDSLDWQRQYLNYLKNLNLTHVPMYGESAQQPPPEASTPEPRAVQSGAGKREKAKPMLEPPPPTDEIVPPIAPLPPPEVDTRYYRDLMDCVPMESVSVPLIMHCILEQVVATEEDTIPPSEREPPARSDGIHLALADSIAEALGSLCLSEADEKIIENEFPTYKQKKDADYQKRKNPDGPVLLQFGDDAAVRTHHLKEYDGFEPQVAEEAILQRLPHARLAAGNNTSNQVLYERASRLHDMLRHMLSMDKSRGADRSDVISGNEVDRAMRQCVFESMKLSSVDETGFVKPPPKKTDNLWDDPYTLLVEKIKYLEAAKNSTDDDPETKEKADPEKFDLSSIASELDPLFVPNQNLDSYCFTENFKSPVLLQVLEEAKQVYPCMDTYRHKRDNSTLVVFHNPMTDELRADMKWSASLHSDVGFRNYLDYVAGSITDWTKQEEQKYHAELLAKELEQQKAAESRRPSISDTATPQPGAKRPRSKSPKKGSRRNSPSRSSSKVEDDPHQQFSSPFVHPTSLKAEKEAQMKKQEDDDRQKKEKEAKQSSRGKSEERGKGAKSASSKTSQDGKRPGSSKRPKSGRKSKSRSNSRSGSRDREPKPEEPAPIVKYDLPFTGYDVGNSLIHVRGRSSYLYPCDGGTVKCERIEFEQGEVSVKTTVMKDGHAFVLHIIDPKDLTTEAELNELMTKPKPVGVEELAEKANAEATEKGDETGRSLSSSVDPLPTSRKEEKIGENLFGSWSATLCDGMTLSLSGYGPDGMCEAANQTKKKMLRILGEIPSAGTPTPIPPGMDTPRKGKKSPKSKSPRSKSPKAGKKKAADAEKEAEAQKLEEQKIQEELEKKLQEAEEAAELERKKQRMPSFQQIYISCPDGLSVRYQLDPTTAVMNPDAAQDFYKLMVRQSYPYKTSGKQESERSRAKPAMDEISRVIQNDGTVIKVMLDGSTKILYADGTVCFNPGSGPILPDPKESNLTHTPRSSGSQAPAAMEEQRTAVSAGSKKGSKGRKSSGKTTTETAGTEPSIAGTIAGQAAGLDVDAGPRSEAEQERAASWFTTYMSGEVTVTKPNGTVTNLDSLLSYVATDPVTGEVMISRQDKVVRVDRPNKCGSVCDHVDGTRITKYCRNVEKEREEEEEEEEQQAAEPVWYVRVECPGFASVTFCHEDSSCITTFGSGTSLLTNMDGSYQLSHWNGGRLDMSADGSVMYTPRPDNEALLAVLSASEFGGEAEEVTRPGSLSLPGSELISLGSYIMRHDTEVCCEAVDQEGNVFQVKKTGEVNVINPSNVSQQQGEDSHTVASPKPVKADPMDHHPPRLFVVRSDGSGSELLRLKDVREYIGDAHLDPTTAVIKEVLPDDSKAIGITVMRPHFGNSGDAWLTHKEEDSIIPRNIRTRDLTHFPPKEMKQSGPPFATTVGKGLAVGSAPIPLEPPAAPPCPSALELRQLLQYEPLSKETREHLKEKLIEFSKSSYEREVQEASLQVREPRTTEEQMRASDLLSLVLEFDEEPTPRSPEIVPTSTADANQEVTVNFTSIRVGTMANSSASQLAANVKKTYEAAVAPPPPPVVPPPKPKLTQADWDCIRRGIDEEKSGRESLKNKEVPTYFDSDIGRAWLLSQANDLNAASMQLSADPRRDGTEARMITHMSSEQARDAASQSHRASGAGTVSDTPSKMRPTNPTPAHATGEGTPTKVRPDNPTPFAAAQQRNMRPSNPTPSHAFSPGNMSSYGKGNDVTSGYVTQQYQPSPIPENPTSAQKREDHSTSPPRTERQESDPSDSSHRSALPLETATSDLMVLTRSLMYDASGQPRKDRVRLPMSIMSDKPGAVPNSKFMDVEEPVRRKVRTASIASGVSQGYEKVAERGFQASPPEVVFGVLREGGTYSFPVKLKNVGIDLCRFKIKQPPPGTGIRVHYAPGPVAAGLERQLDVEIYAIAVGVEGDSGVGAINHHLEIITESDILHLPISAIVLTAHDYDNRRDSLPDGGKAPGVKLCSSKPPSRDGILRPHKVAVK